MKLKTKALIILIITLLSLLYVSVAQARPKYQPQVRPMEGCNVCHVNQGGGGPMNAYGADWESSGMSAAKAAKLDSDNDGFTNGEEIEAKTFPGDPNSNPKSGSLIWLYLAIAIIVIGGTVGLFIAAAKVRAKQDQQKSEDDE